MSTPAGHRLGDAARYTNGTKTVFRAECECGVSCYGARLPRVWEAHDLHLALVKGESMRNHPSRKDGAA